MEAHPNGVIPSSPPPAPADPLAFTDSVTAELKKLWQQSSHYLLGLIGSLGLGFVSFPIYTRVFSVADFGLIDFVSKILLLLTATSKFGLQNAALRFYDHAAMEKDPGEGRRFYSTMYFGIGTMAGAVALLVVAFLHTSASSLIGKTLVSLLLLTAPLVFLRAIQSMLWTFLRVEERTKFYNVMALILRASTIAAVVGLLPWLGRSVGTYFRATMMVESAVMVGLSAPLIRRGMLRLRDFDWSLFRKGFTFGVPLVVLELAGITLDTGDRALVRYYLGDNALGYYSVAYGLSTYVNTLLITPLNLAIIPIYMRLWRTEGDEKTIEFLSFGLNALLVAAAGAFAIATVSAHDGVILFASEKYRGADSLIPAVLGGLLIYTTYPFLSTGLLIYNKTYLLAGVLLCAAAVNITMNCLLLPRIGLQGAALSTLASYIVCIALLAGASFRYLRLRVRFRALLGQIAAAGIAWGLASRVELTHSFLNLVTRATLALILYAGMVYLFDPWVRRVVLQVWKRLRPQPAFSTESA